MPLRWTIPSRTVTPSCMGCHSFFSMDAITRLRMWSSSAVGSGTLARGLRRREAGQTASQCRPAISAHTGKRLNRSVPSIDRVLKRHVFRCGAEIACVMISPTFDRAHAQNPAQPYVNAHEEVEPPDMRTLRADLAAAIKSPSDTMPINRPASSTTGSPLMCCCSMRFAASRRACRRPP